MSSVKTDPQGFLVSLNDWNQEVAKEIAANESIELTDAHWEVIDLLRSFYREFELSPSMRIFVKHIKQNLGDRKGNSIYLMSLFPGSPAKLASKISGLPKPDNCL